MNIVTEIDTWLQLKKQFKEKSLGFVPTMGHLHAGHASLCERALDENDEVMVSIFVNPMQFNETSDYVSYTRSLDDDVALLKKIGVKYLFLPAAQAMYPDQYECRVLETSLSDECEGRYRPGHFTGMLTVVLKLLNIIGADKAYFGEKDFQQLLLIKKMVTAFFLRTKIVACPTVRAPDGLALSSRNTRLSAKQHALALHFPELLKSGKTCEEIISALTHLGFKVDYIKDKWMRRLGAVWIDDIRLIDNIPIGDNDVNYGS